MFTLSTIKTHGSAKIRSLLYKRARRHRNVGDPASAYPSAIKVSPAQTVEQSQNGSIYRLNLSKQKGRSFLDCVSHLTHETESNRLLGKQYDDSEIKANFDSCAIGSKGKKCAALQELSERDRFRYEVLYSGMTIRQVIEQTNRLSNDSEKLDKSV